MEPETIWNGFPSSRNSPCPATKLCGWFCAAEKAGTDATRLKNKAIHAHRDCSAIIPVLLHCPSVCKRLHLLVSENFTLKKYLRF
jgi:hypothetical protein